MIGTVNPKKKKRNTINSITNYHREMKLVPIIMDYCLFQFDAVKYFLGVRLFAESLPNINFFNANPGTDVIQAGTVDWRLFVGAITRQLVPDRCFPMCRHRWSMDFTMRTDDDTLENTGEPLFVKGGKPPWTHPQNIIKNCNN